MVEIILSIEEVEIYAPPRVSIYEDEEHQIQISDSTRPEFMTKHRLIMSTR